MALPTHQIDPLDPNVSYKDRSQQGVMRTGDVVLDTPYGDAGVPEYARWLYVGVTGHVSYVRWDGQTQVLSNMGAGIWHPIYSKMINTTGTTATGLVWGS